MSKIRIRHGEDEIELDGSDSFIKNQLEAFYKRVQSLPAMAPATLKKDIQVAAAKKPSQGIPSPAEFYRAKNRTDGVSKILIFGKYLEEYRNKTEFTPLELNEIAKEVKLSKDIHPQYYSNAVRQGLLRGLGGGKYSLTLSAEDAIAVMR